MDEKELKENLKIAGEILKKISIPGKKDSMLAAAKLDHVERIGILLNDVLIRTGLSQTNIDEIVSEFKELYTKNFLRYIQKEE